MESLSFHFKTISKLFNNRISTFISELVLQNPRPYDVTTLFTVRSGCDECESVLTELTGVQYSYRQAKVDSFFGVFYYSS